MKTISENNDRVKDFFSASNEEALDVLTSEILPEIAKEVAKVTVGSAVSEIVGGICGAIAPRINGIVLNYRQKRLESNVSFAIEKLNARCDEIEKAIGENPDRKLISSMIEFLFDNIADEPQIDKVQDNVNGFIGLLCDHNTTEDMALMFFKTLYQLNRLDIKLLRLFVDRGNRTQMTEFKEKYSVSDEFFDFMCEKLERLGLLINATEKRNNDRLKSYYKMAANNKYTAQMPRLEESSRKSYSASKLGRRYIELMKPELFNVKAEDVSEEVSVRRLQ